MAVFFPFTYSLSSLAGLLRRRLRRVGHSLQSNEFPAVLLPSEVGADGPPPGGVFRPIGRDVHHDETVDSRAQVARRLDAGGLAGRLPEWSRVPGRVVELEPCSAIE